MQRIRTFLALTLLVPIGTALFSVGEVAQAATEIQVVTAEATVFITKVGSARSSLVVTRVGGNISIVDKLDTPNAGQGCTLGGTREVLCGLKGVFFAKITMGAGNDEVRFNVPGITDVDLVGGPGNDKLGIQSLAHTTFDGGPGDDSMQGGPGVDLFLSGERKDGADSFRGGGGTDSVDYGTRAAGVVASMNGVADDGEPGEKDYVATDVEYLSGGFGADRLSGSDKADNLFGGDGNDQLSGLGGNDTLSGDDGDDTLYGGTGNDFADYTTWITIDDNGDGNDRFVGDAGTDTVSYAGRTIGGAVAVDLDGIADDGSISLKEKDNQVGVENVVGTDLDDKLTGDANANVLTGGTGQDSLHGGGGNDSLRGDGGDDAMFGQDGNDTLIGAAGHDALDGGVGNDSFDGGADNDTMLGQAGNDTFHGGPGPTASSDDDVITGGLGTDLVSYNGRSAAVRVDGDNQPDDGVVGSERDVVSGSVENIAGGNGNDTLTGNAAANVLQGQGGADRLEVKDGSPLKDTANGGAGTDTCTADALDTRIACER